MSFVHHSSVRPKSKGLYVSDYYELEVLRSDEEGYWLFIFHFFPPRIGDTRAFVYDDGHVKCFYAR